MSVAPHITHNTSRHAQRPMSLDVFWSALEAAGSAIVSVAAAFVIARIIGPTELGIGAAAVALRGIGGVRRSESRNYLLHDTLR